MVVINDSSKFENIISDLISSYGRIIEIFNRQNSNMEIVNDTDVWSGLTQSTVCTKYEQLSNNYQAISDSLATYINSLSQTLNNYKAFEEKTQNDAEGNNASLDVNS